MMTKEAKGQFQWVFIVSAFLVICGVIWSSSAEIQTIDSRSQENRTKIDYLDAKMERSFIRFEDKIDLLIERSK